MKVILRQEVEGLGRAGEIKEVKKGYANNFLIPKKFAYPATKHYINMVEQEKRARLKKEEREKKRLEKLKEKIENLSLTVQVKVGENEKMFGSVTTQNIVEKLKEQGINIDKKNILLEEPIKKLGIYHLPIKLGHNIESTLKLWVVKE